MTNTTASASLPLIQVKTQEELHTDYVEALRHNQVHSATLALESIVELRVAYKDYESYILQLIRERVTCE